MPARRSVRKRAKDSILVTNAMTGATLGRIGNLSVDGMMLITPQALPEGRLYQLQFLLSDAELQQRRMEVGIQCMWSDAARTEGTYWTGCRIIDIAAAEQTILGEWVERAAEGA
jgi:hypothetical protein